MKILPFELRLEQQFPSLISHVSQQLLFSGVSTWPMFVGLCHGVIKQSELFTGHIHSKCVDPLFLIHCLQGVRTLPQSTNESCSHNFFLHLIHKSLKCVSLGFAHVHSQQRTPFHQRSRPIRGHPSTEDGSTN